MHVQQALVIGLGQFGMALARSLAQQGVEVLAIDHREDRVQIAASFATEAVAMDAMDEDDLSTVRPAVRDLCVCAIGDDSREASIVVTAMLRQMGAPRVVSRAVDTLHERILQLVGAHEVLNPERLMAERLAASFSYRGVLDVLPLGDGLVITELESPTSLHGRTLGELHMPRTYELTVLGVRRTVEGRTTVVLPRADTAIRPGDILLVVGPDGAARRFAQGV